MMPIEIVSESYIERVFEKFGMKFWSSLDTLITKVISLTYHNVLKLSIEVQRDRKDFLHFNYKKLDICTDLYKTSY